MVLLHVKVKMSLQKLCVVGLAQCLPRVPKLVPEDSR